MTRWTPALSPYTNPWQSPPSLPCGACEATQPPGSPARTLPAAHSFDGALQGALLAFLPHPRPQPTRGTSRRLLGWPWLEQPCGYADRLMFV